MTMHVDDGRLFRVLVQSVTDYAIFRLSPSGIVQSWNAGAERLKGYTSAEIIGKSFEQFYTPEERAAGRPQYLLGIARAEGRVETLFVNPALWIAIFPARPNQAISAPVRQ